jgi:HSP20 family protein
VWYGTEKTGALELVSDTLTIRGEKRGKKVKEKNHYCVERSFGFFQRVLSLPEDVDQEGIEADFKRGILTIHRPRTKPTAAAVRRIEAQKG